LGVLIAQAKKQIDSTSINPFLIHTSKMKPSLHLLPFLPNITHLFPSLPSAFSASLRFNHKNYSVKSKIQNPKFKIALLGINLSTIFLWPIPTQSAPVPSTPPANCPPLEQEVNSPPPSTPTPGSVRTADTISQTGLTPPSLWWANEQFGDKLLDNWCAYPDQRRVDLVVNRQIWSLLTYLERYEFVNHFGTVARDFNYNLRVFNQQKTLLATYTCDYSTTPARCNLWIDTPIGRAFQSPSIQN
jgi:hypothetical protein